MFLWVLATARLPVSNGQPDTLLAMRANRRAGTLPFQFGLYNDIQLTNSYIANSQPQHRKFGAAVIFEVSGGRQPAPYDNMMLITR
jgi:hypothetical protein